MEEFKRKKPMTRRKLISIGWFNKFNELIRKYPHDHLKIFEEFYLYGKEEENILTRRMRK